MARLLLLAFVCFCFCYGANAQQLYMQVLDNQSIIPKELNLNGFYASTIDAQNKVELGLNKIRESGHLAANLDSIVTKKDTMRCFVHIGKKYQWAKIKSSAVPQILMDQLRLDKFFTKGQSVNIEKYKYITEKILTYSENNGYPFAKVFLDSLTFSNDSISGIYSWDQGPLIKIDSIDISGDVSISPGFIYQFIGIHPGDLYNEALIKNIAKRIAELPFAQEEKRSRVYYSTSKTILNIYLKDKSADQADVLVGILPNTSTIPGVANILLFTGDVKLGLTNAFSYGESMNLNWQNLQYRSPRMNIDFSLPYIGGTVLGAAAKFNYVKNDSSFRTVFGELALQYITKPNNYIKAFYQNGNSRLITVDTNYIKQFKALPANADVANNSFGLEWQSMHFDYAIAPRKGWSAKLNGAVSRRSFIKNTEITTLQDISRGTTFEYLYDSIAQKSNSINMQSTFQYFQPIAKQVSIRGVLTGAKVYNANLFKNELFQIGGYRNLRGFNEASLFVSDYAILSLEPRYYFGRNSYFQLVADYALMRSFLSNNNQWQNGAGIGGGITLDAKAGLFNVLYAVGNNLENKFVLRNAKIHFGYINRF